MKIFVKALDSYKKEEFKEADSLFGIVIKQSKNINKSMPLELNPYYFRGHLAIELESYQRAISDFDQVASNTTNNTDILTARSEAFRELSQYDTAIAICNKLLVLGVDSAIVLSQRGLCYYEKKQMDLACIDLLEAKRLRPADSEWLDKFLKDCK